MSSQFSLSSDRHQKRFSIDDAFEEETDEAIKVYGATVARSPISNGSRHIMGEGDQVSISTENGRTYKLANDASRDSDSLIQDYYECSSQDNMHRSCFKHPKVRENWRMVLAATTLLIIGIGLLVTGTITLSEPNSGLQGSVFLLAGFICFVPGAYHVVYIYLAAKGNGVPFPQLTIIHIEFLMLILRHKMTH